MICSLWNIIFFWINFHRIDVFKQLKHWNLFLQNINEEAQAYIFNVIFWYVILIEYCDVEAFVAALDGFLLVLYIIFLLTVIVERLLIGHYRLNVSSNYYSFCVNSFILTFLLLHSVRKRSIFQNSHLIKLRLLEIFKVWPLMQFIKRNFGCHTLFLNHFLRNLFW